MPFAIEVYVSRAVLDCVTDADLEAAALRLRYFGPLHWERSTNDLPSHAPAGSLRVRCNVGEALVFLECLRTLVDAASARQDDERLITYAEVMGVIMDAVERASNRQN